LEYQYDLTLCFHVVIRSDFFQKFALILFMTVLQATIGSFIVFLTMVDCVGPNQPTIVWDYLVDKIKEKCFPPKSKPKENDVSVMDMTAHEQSNE
jgi:hypothetical protein